MSSLSTQFDPPLYTGTKLTLRREWCMSRSDQNPRIQVSVFSASFAISSDGQESLISWEGVKLFLGRMCQLPSILASAKIRLSNFVVKLCNIERLESAESSRSYEHGDKQCRSCFNFEQLLGRATRFNKGLSMQGTEWRGKEGLLATIWTICQEQDFQGALRGQGKW